MLTDEQLYIENSTTARSVVRRRILYDNLIEYKCSICSSEPKWRGQDMSLILDHENGINNDNRLTNLRFLCPNCNHQQPTYAGKNKRKTDEKKCVDCNKTIHKNSIRCNGCSAKKKHADGLMSYSN